MNDQKFDSMIGKTMVSVAGCKPGSYELIFQSDDGHTFKFFHDQDCCENVRVEDVCGDPNDLVGNPIVMAEEVSEEEPELDYTPDSWTWTFFKFATIQGHVTVRWLGESNGYYSESVDFLHTEPKE